MPNTNQALSYDGGSTLKDKAEILSGRRRHAAQEQTFGNQFPPYGFTAALITAVNTTLASCNGSSYITLATTLDGWINRVH